MTLVRILEFKIKLFDESLFPFYYSVGLCISLRQYASLLFYHLSLNFFILFKITRLTLVEMDYYRDFISVANACIDVLESYKSIENVSKSQVKEIEWYTHIRSILENVQSRTVQLRRKLEREGPSLILTKKGGTSSITSEAACKLLTSYGDCMEGLHSKLKGKIIYRRRT